ncbi:hypothetical protein ACYJ3J_16825 [Mycobacterium avium subsp. paratuberculosis]|uniref:Mpt64 n=2 Tax=Mycobacterium avium TaxID=1764 RepID=Q73US6_MYCPA|nr:hypothetical protein [Mycobacterium avium]ELP45070.1 Mpt64 [Mycobacterium avium subsp. paratuberculosis S5]AAS05840.1 Mpt64 [Mycobacterium avium subsp. paratuberculosis K-10]AGL35457.1 hypothetical protein MAP4_0495 [Mycobacterium avium subsp. paratuberculosis MAP4]ASE13975.1 hypothetical protein CEP84_09250 [Mycobacterium avium subsp. paratuberculosis]ASF97342.1 hypothetical protein CEG92_17250 [Mycobacterium avium subsp. paratuberculosis]
MRSFSVAAFAAALVLVGPAGAAAAPKDYCADLKGANTGQTCQIQMADPGYNVDISFPANYPDEQPVADFISKQRDDSPARAGEADVGERDRDGAGKVAGDRRVDGTDHGGEQQRGHRPSGQQRPALLPAAQPTDQCGGHRRQHRAAQQPVQPRVARTAQARLDRVDADQPQECDQADRMPAPRRGLGRETAGHSPRIR